MNETEAEHRNDFLKILHCTKPLASSTVPRVPLDGCIISNV